jgi:hypothetical protein
MQNKDHTTADIKDDIAALEAEIREAVAQGENIQEAVRHLTLKAMNADRIDLESLRRIMAAAMQGAGEGVQHNLQHASDQSQTAKTQITEAIAGLDSALAGVAEASKLAIEEATSRAQRYSDTELARARADLESLETMFMDTLQNTATTAKGFVADTLHDLAGHAKHNGTAVGEQLKQTLGTFTQQMTSVGHTKIDAGVKLAHATADLISKIASGILSGMADQGKSSDKPKDDSFS